MDKIIVYFLLLSSTTVFAQNDDNQCEGDQVLNTVGVCADPDISRNIYVFAAPADTGEGGSEEEEVFVPKPKLEYNIVFVRTPEGGAGAKPIVVPPPQQKTIVYVLSKKGEKGKQPIIQVPAPPKHKPEVYYVNYAEGENPLLPGGVNLQTALDSETVAAEDVGAGVPAPEVVPAPEDAPVAEVAPISVASGYSGPETPPAPAAPAGDIPTAPAAPAGDAPQSPENPSAQQQQSNFIIVTPQPPVFVSPQGGLGNRQPIQFLNQRGELVNLRDLANLGHLQLQPSQLGTFQPLGFPAAQG